MSVFSFVRLHARPSQEDELLRAAGEVLEPTRAEPGCQSIKLFRSTADPAVLFFHSAWKSADAFQDHSESSHLKAFLARLPDLMTGPPDVTITERVG